MHIELADKNNEYNSNTISVYSELWFYAALPSLLLFF